MALNLPFCPRRPCVLFWLPYSLLPPSTSYTIAICPGVFRYIMWPSLYSNPHVLHVNNIARKYTLFLQSTSFPNLYSLSHLASTAFQLLRRSKIPCLAPRQLYNASPFYILNNFLFSSGILKACHNGWWNRFGFIRRRKANDIAASITTSSAVWNESAYLFLLIVNI